MDVKSKVLASRPEGDAKLDLSLSVSKVKTFKDCKAKFHFSYIEKLPKKDWDFHVFGKFLHEVLETYYKKIIAGDDRLPNIILTDSWKAAFINWKEKLNAEQVAEAKQICMEFLQTLNSPEAKPTVLAVERPFYIDIDGKILLNGFIDRVQIDADGTLHVTDYKTTKNKKYLKNDFFQLLTYAFVMCLDDPSIKRVRGSYILLRHGFEMIVKDFEKDEIMAVEKTFLDYGSTITDEKLFRPSPSRLCDYCDFIDHCDAGQRMTGKTIITPKFGQDNW